MARRPRPTTQLQMELEKQFFTKGAAVEVFSDEPGFRGSWFTATVISPVNQETRELCIEYHTLVCEEDTSKPLRENVGALFVRPPAPRETSRKFKLYEEVNAFHKDAWWEGRINGVTGKGDRFLVYFPYSREQFEFRPSDLRLHREWVRGDWVPPLEIEEGGGGNGGNGAGTSSSK